jgi:dTDP-4-dehydrorhamnose reductase
LKKRILIIGSNGYLGKKLKKDLKYSYNIREFSIKKIKRDIRKKNQVKEFFLKNNDLDIVLNLTGQISNNLKKTNTTNILGTKNIIQYSNKDTLLIFFS